jgi:1,4-dihydroxy-2-naphthoate octaprenyltransferase
MTHPVITSPPASVRPTPAVRPGSARAWILAIRPATLTVALGPVLVGTAVAHVRGGARALPALAAALGALLIQVATNFANDVFDHEKGADTAERLGPVRATQAGLLTPAQMKRGMWLVIAAALAVGAYLVMVGGWPILLVGVVSIASGLAYTGGPFPLAYNGLGDLFVFVFFGLVAVTGATYVQTGGVEPLALVASLPAGAIATAVLVVNNVRDRHTDVGANKRTLVVRFGRRFAELEYVALLAVAYGAPVGLVLTGSLGPAALAPLATLPLAALSLRALLTREGASLNPVLGSTARLLLAHSALFAAGIAAAR